MSAAAPLPNDIAAPRDAGDIDGAGLEMLAALLVAARHTTGAAAAWWESAASPPVRLVGDEPPVAPAARSRFDAVSGGCVFARLVLDGVDTTPAPVRGSLQALATAGAAVLRATAERSHWQLLATRLHDASRVATDWLWETDADGMMVWMTDAISALTGRAAGDEIGSLPLDHNRVRGDEYGDTYRRYLDDRAARRPFRGLVLDRDTPQGTITVLINGDPRFDADGRFAGYRGATRNITGEIRARDEARRAQMLLQQTLEGLPAAVMISGPDGRILMANTRWRETAGKNLPADCTTWESMLRHHLRLGHYPEAAGREEAFIAWRLAQPQERPAPVEVRWRDEWMLSADQRLADGSIVHLTMFITEQKRAQQALQRAEDRWRFALEVFGHGLWEWDHEDGVVYSPSWAQVLGHDVTEVGSGLDEWLGRVHPDDRPMVDAAREPRHRAGAGDLFEAEYRLRHKDGHYIWVHDRTRVIARDEAGRPVRMIGSMSDVTRLREADQALRDKQAAERLNRSTNEFLSRMSHEMRTPLNAVIGFADLMHSRGEYRADHMAHIVTAGQQLLRLIDDVLDLQQVEQGALALRQETVDARRLLHEAASMLRPQALLRGLAQHLPGEGAALVRADSTRLRQVLLNLGSNAIKYNRVDGEVRWSVDQSDSTQLGLVVEDTGPGLDAAQRERLFRPFERLGRETSDTEGTGLGLVISRRLVEAMGGRLALHSTPGIGTRVEVWLPRADAAVASAPGTGALPPGAARVLYVEDNPVNAALLEEALHEEAGCEVRLAADGDEALRIVRDWRPDLLVIDMHLPGPDGHQVLKRLRAMPGLAAVPAVMCSADVQPGDRERARDAGFAAYWTKPVDLAKVVAEVRELLAARSI